MTNLKQSPMNYTGNKYKLLHQLLPLFPDTVCVQRFCDVFCGGLAVSLNVPYKHIYCSDIESPLIAIYKAMITNNEFERTVDDILNTYSVKPDNEEGYMRMRNEYNNSNDRRPELLFALISTAYNALYRFNSNDEYNAPFGFDKNTFNKSKRTCLRTLIDFVRQPTVSIESMSYREVKIQDGDFVYCDPPYLITGAAYNTAWKHTDEYALLRWLDALNMSGIKFGLSNVTRHQGKTNVPLVQWSKKYNVHELDHKYTTYANGKHRNFPTQEVYICNY